MKDRGAVLARAAQMGDQDRNGANGYDHRN